MLPWSTEKNRLHHNRYWKRLCLRSVHTELNLIALHAYNIVFDKSQFVRANGLLFETHFWIWVPYGTLDNFFQKNSSRDRSRNNNDKILWKRLNIFKLKKKSGFLEFYLNAMKILEISSKSTQLKCVVNNGFSLSSNSFESTAYCIVAYFYFLFIFATNFRGFHACDMAKVNFAISIFTLRLLSPAHVLPSCDYVAQLITIFRAQRNRWPSAFHCPLILMENT